MSDGTYLIAPPEWVTLELVLEQLQQIMIDRWHQSYDRESAALADKFALQAINYRLRLWTGQ